MKTGGSQGPWKNRPKGGLPAIFGAGNGTRTRGIQLGRLTLYHLSYSRILKNILATRAGEVNRDSAGLSRLNR